MQNLNKWREKEEHRPYRSWTLSQWCAAGQHKWTKDLRACLYVFVVWEKDAQKIGISKPYDPIRSVHDVYWRGWCGFFYFLVGSCIETVNICIEFIAVNWSNFCECVFFNCLMIDDVPRNESILCHWTSLSSKEWKHHSVWNRTPYTILHSNIIT